MLCATSGQRRARAYASLVIAMIIPIRTNRTIALWSQIHVGDMLTRLVAERGAQHLARLVAARTIV